MRVVFMGTPVFSVTVLSALAEQHEIVAVYTRPDAASGRGRSLRPSPVKERALSLAIPVEQPPTLRAPEVHQRLAELRPDVVCVAAYGLILPPEVLAIPPHGCINVHASLLPAHRGAAPVQRAILDGDDVTGVSIMLMEPGLDTGPVAKTVETQVDRHSTDSLTHLLAEIGSVALLEVLDEIEAGTAVWEPQSERLATYAAKITKDDVALTAELTAEEADRRVRASDRRAPSRVRISGVTLTVLEADPVDDAPGPGIVACHEKGIVIGFAEGGLALTRVRPEGRSDMAADCYLRGARIPARSTWERA